MFPYRYIIETVAHHEIIASAAMGIASSRLGRRGGRWYVEAERRGLLFSFTTEDDMMRFIGCWQSAIGARRTRRPATQPQRRAA